MVECRFQLEIFTTWNIWNIKPIKLINNQSIKGPLQMYTHIMESRYEIYKVGKKGGRVGQIRYLYLAKGSAAFLFSVWFMNVLETLS